MSSGLPRSKTLIVPPVLNDPDERIEIGIQLDQPAAGVVVLDENETAGMTVTTRAGGSTQIRLSVPGSLAGDSAVLL